MRISEHTYPAGLSQERHYHSEAGFSILLSGTLRERVGRTEEIARPMSIVAKPIGIEHANLFGPTQVRLVRIALSEAEAAEVTPWAPSLASWRWSHTGPATRAFLQVAHVAHNQDAASDHERLVYLGWDALAALAIAANTNGAKDPPSWLTKVREALDDTSHPPRLSDLASLADVHPVYLARQFRRFFGCSVSTYVHRRRVQRTAELMALSPEPLSRISYEAGFTDQPHMCRIFRRETGLTPTEYRAIQRAGCDCSRRRAFERRT
jgi:AraC family transcriptional regulator